MIGFVIFMVPLLILNEARARDLTGEDSISAVKKRCLQEGMEIIQMQQGLTLRQAAPLSQVSALQKIYLNELFLFCDCMERNPGEGALQYPEKDFCAQEKFSSLSYQYFFHGQMVQIATYVRERLNRRLIPGIRMVASGPSLYQRQQCLEESILTRCSVRQSLALTYLCIEKYLKDPYYHLKVEQACPSLNTDEVDENLPISGEFI